MADEIPTNAQAIDEIIMLEEAILWIGADDYNKLKNKPQINGVTLVGNLTAEELGMATPEDVEKAKEDAQRTYATIISLGDVKRDLKALKDDFDSTVKIEHIGTNLRIEADGTLEAIQPDVSKFVNKDAIDNELAKKADLSSLETLSRRVEGKASKEEVEANHVLIRSTASQQVNNYTVPVLTPRQVIEAHTAVKNSKNVVVVDNLIDNHYVVVQADEYDRGTHVVIAYRDIMMVTYSLVDGVVTTSYNLIGGEGAKIYQTLGHNEDGAISQKVTTEALEDIAEDIEELNDKVKEIELFKFPNLTIIGEPTIQAGQISGFSKSNYLEFPFLVDFHNQPFEISFSFTTGNDVVNQQNILDSEFGLAFAIRNSRMVLAVSYDGRTWAFEKVGNLVIMPNTTYRVKISWSKINYKVAYSIDGGETYVDDMNMGGTQQPYPRQMYIGIGKLADNVFGGSINLNYATLTVGGSVIWQGMDDAGLSTRLATDLSNIDELGKERIREIAVKDIISGEPIVTGTGKEFTLENTANIMLADVKILGEAEQGENPTPDNPQPINVVTGVQEIIVGGVTHQIDLGDIELAKIGEAQDAIYRTNGKWYLFKTTRHIRKAVADMNNQEDYPGWRGGDVNVLDQDFGHGYNGTMANASNGFVNVFRDFGQMSANTLLADSAMFLRSLAVWGGLNQTQIKERYPDVVVDVFYIIPSGAQEIEITDQTLVASLEALANSSSILGDTTVRINGLGELEVSAYTNTLPGITAGLRNEHEVLLGQIADMQHRLNDGLGA